MRTAPVVFLSLALTLWAGARPAAANVCGPVPDTLVLLDRSGSMKQLVGPDSKWSIAKSAVNNLTGTFAGQLNFGLMLFSRWPHVSNCSSGKVNVGVGPGTVGAISSTLNTAYPDGDTPIALSLDEARVYLQQVASGKPQYVILVTDGMETCQPASVNSPPVAAGKLLAGGLMHGLYASGGPMAVYYTSRQLPEKGHFRATLSVLWLLLNAVLMGSYLLGGKLGRGTAELVGLNLPALCAGIWCGEWLHGRLPQTAFRRIVLLLLLAGGLVLLVAGGR